VAAENETDERDPEEIRREREAQARESNTRRNSERLARMEQIADSAENTPEHRDDEPVTDDMWQAQETGEEPTEEQINARAIARAQKESEGEEEPSGDEEPAREAGNEEEELDEAREAGADDVRVKNGVKEYLLVINGKRVWKTLTEIRTAASKIEAADEYLQTATETVRNATRATPTSEENVEAARQFKERKAHIADLYRRANLGDEQAIDELAEIQAAPSAVTPDVLRTLDERFDSRVTFREAVDWFEGEYEPELKHPAMKLYAGQLDAALAKANPTMSPKVRLKKVGEQIRRETRETFGTRSSSGPSGKAQRKAEVRGVTPAGERRQERNEDTEEESTQSVIQKIAQGRHQPRAVVHGPTRNNR
jgi:hypothetical protein